MPSARFSRTPPRTGSHRRWVAARAGLWNLETVVISVRLFTGAEPGLVSVVCLPLQVDDVGVDGVGFFGSHLGLDQGPPRARPETGHAILTMTATQHDA